MYRTQSELDQQAQHLIEAKSGPIRRLTAAEILRSVLPWVEPKPHQMPRIIIDTDIRYTDLTKPLDRMDLDLYIDTVIGRLEARNNMQILDPYDTELRRILYRYARLRSSP